MNDLAAAEQAARAARRGPWADREPVPPWEWRATERERKAAARQAAGSQEGERFAVYRR